MSTGCSFNILDLGKNEREWGTGQGEEEVVVGVKGARRFSVFFLGGINSALLFRGPGTEGRRAELRCCRASSGVEHTSVQNGVWPAAD